MDSANDCSGADKGPRFNRAIEVATAVLETTRIYRHQRGCALLAQSVVSLPCSVRGAG